MHFFSVFYPEKWAIEAYYGGFSGFYIRNPTDFDAQWFERNKSYPTLSRQMQQNASTDFYYIFNHRRFAYQAIYCKSTRHIASTGTWLAGGYGYYVHTQNNGYTDLPTTLANDAMTVLMHNGSFWNGGISGGYAQSLVYQKNWFANALVTAGVGASYQPLMNPATKEVEMAWGAGAKLKQPAYHQRAL